MNEAQICMATGWFCPLLDGLPVNLVQAFISAFRTNGNVIFATRHLQKYLDSETIIRGVFNHCFDNVTLTHAPTSQVV